MKTRKIYICNYEDIIWEDVTKSAEWITHSTITKQSADEFIKIAKKNKLHAIVKVYEEVYNEEEQSWDQSNEEEIYWEN